MAATLEYAFMKDYWKSARLRFRAFDAANDRLSEFALESDPVTAVLGNVPPIAPTRAKTEDDWKSLMSKNVLFVIICLPAEDDQEKPGEAIGTIHLTNHRGPVFAMHRSAMLGLSINSVKHQGKGYGPEAIEWILEKGFNQHGLHRIHLGAWSFNVNALKAYRKFGFVEEGLEREAIFFNGKWFDIVNFSLLEHEWRARQKQ